MAVFDITIIIGAVLLTFFGGLFAAYIGLLERKLIGRIHSRYGPTMVGPYGLLQTVADAIKFMQKDFFVPKRADKLLFIVSPVFLTFLSFLLLSYLPWGNFSFIVSQYDLLIILGIVALSPVIILVAAWASNSKYSSIGGLRAVTQILAYEGVLFLSILPLVFISGSFSLAEIISAQKNYWFMFSEPFAFLLFLFAVIAITERQPFDLPEAESELVQGWLTEFGGPFFAVILLGQYIMLYVASFLLAALFLGGWGGAFGWIGFAVKVFAGVLVFIISRATYFRMRLDQLLDFSWKFLVPLGFANFLLSLLIVYTSL